MNSEIGVAIAKGRVLKEAMPLLAALGIRPLEAPGETRKLILQTNHPGVSIIVVRAVDVPTYVEYGAADLGIVGKDVLLEYDGDGLYEPLDLRIARCKMVVAAAGGGGASGRKKRVATKYIKTAYDYFASSGQQVELIKLYGSMELAPALNLADQIVDLVDTGNTLRANDLVEVALITKISARLIINKGAMKMKHALIRPLVKKLTELVDGNENQTPG